jgi:hypothetical protein
LPQDIRDFVRAHPNQKPIAHSMVQRHVNEYQRSQSSAEGPLLPTTDAGQEFVFSVAGVLNTLVAEVFTL